MFGMFLALIFRTSEQDAQQLNPVSSYRPKTQPLRLPGGKTLTLLALPENRGWMSQDEIPQWLWARFSSQPEYAGPAERVSFAEAKAFCQWLSQESGRRVRLPSAEEWRMAARSHLPGAEYAWGYGLKHRPDSLHLELEEAPRRSGPKLSSGYRDLAGGRWEWCEEGWLLGSAWSEQDPRFLSLDSMLTVAEGYSGQDTGLRILVESD